MTDRRLSEVVAEGDLRASLAALRDELAVSMERADPNVKPQYAARLQSLVEAIAALPDVEGSPVDDLVARRKARRASSDAGVRAKKQAGRSGAG